MYFPCGRPWREAERLRADVMRVITREMAISHDELHRVLNMAFGDEFKANDPEGIEFVSDDGRIRLCLSGEGSRRIGSITMPVTELSLKFRDMNEAAVSAFMVRFDRSFQRGGG